MPKTNNPAPAPVPRRQSREGGTNLSKSNSTATDVVRPPTRTSLLITLMRAEGGTSAQSLAEAVGWQVHSVRGFISGTLKKRTDLVVTTRRVDGVTRYAVADAPEANP